MDLNNELTLNGQNFLEENENVNYNERNRSNSTGFSEASKSAILRPKNTRRILSIPAPGKTYPTGRIHARGGAAGRWKFQSAISILTRGGGRRSRRTAKRLSISCKSAGIVGRGAQTHLRISTDVDWRARVACLLLKCLHWPVGRRNTPDIADFSSTTAGNARPFTKISVSECYSFSAPFPLPFLELMKTSYHFFLAFDKRERFESRDFVLLVMFRAR